VVSTAARFVAIVVHAADDDEWIVGCGRPAVIDFRTSAEENVYPMVPAGQEITEMIGGTSRKRRKP